MYRWLSNGTKRPRWSCACHCGHWFFRRGLLRHGADRPFRTAADKPRAGVPFAGLFLARSHGADPDGDAYQRPDPVGPWVGIYRSEEHTSELLSLMRISYAVFCLKKKSRELQM